MREMGFFKLYSAEGRTGLGLKPEYRLLVSYGGDIKHDMHLDDWGIYRSVSKSWLKFSPKQSPYSEV